MTTELIVLVVFIGTTVTVLGIGCFLVTWFQAERTTVRRRVHDLAIQLDIPGFEEQALDYVKKKVDWKQYEIFSDCPPLLNLPELFQQAGIYMDVKRWLVVVVSVSVGLTFLTGLMMPSLGWILCVFLLSLFSPYLFVLWKRNRRLKAFESSFAQSLEILGRSLRAGHPLTMGLQMVAQEMPEPVMSEFGQVFYEQQMGLPLDESLKRMAQRVPLLDVRFFVLSVLIHQQIGGDLAEVMGNLSRVIRDRFKVLGQVKALTAEGRLSGWVLSALPVAVFLIINVINPPYVQTLLQTDLGRRMLVGAVVSQGLGMLTIQKIVRIKI